MGDSRYFAALVVPDGRSACATCGHRWKWVADTMLPAWEGAGIAVCSGCLERIRRAVRAGEEPHGAVERLVLYCLVGVDEMRMRAKR